MACPANWTAYDLFLVQCYSDPSSRNWTRSQSSPTWPSDRWNMPFRGDMQKTPTSDTGRTSQGMLHPLSGGPVWRRFTTHVLVPAVLGIPRRGPAIEIRAQPMSPAEHPVADQSLHRPTLLHELPGQVVEELLVRAALAPRAEVVRSADQPLSEQVLPDTVHRHAAGERVLGAGEPVGHLQPAADAPHA
jgi:hypothetical protein